jgi:hypothetical protein
LAVADQEAAAAEVAVAVVVAAGAAVAGNRQFIPRHHRTI